MDSPEARVAAALAEALHEDGWLCHYDFGTKDCTPEDHIAPARIIAHGALAADPTIARHMALGAAVEAAEGEWRYSVDYDRRSGDCYYVEFGPKFHKGEKRAALGPTLIQAIDAALRDPEEAERE